MAFKALAKETVSYNGKEREYNVADRNLPGAPRWFISYQASQPIPVFISDEVPKPFRGFMVIHEIAEFEDLKGQQDPCRKALEIELSHVFPQDLRDYAAFRKTVFEELIGYHKRHSPTSPFISEMQKSLDYLLILSP